MHIAAVPTVTLIFAAALGLLNVWLGVRVSRGRMTHKVLIGHGDIPAMEARMRAHANFNEYVPIALILMLLIELNVGASRWLWGLGALLVVARVIHPLGMDRPTPNALRAAGAFVTWGVLLALVVWAVLLAYGIRL
ncbi:MAPEG family protein [Sphingomonas crusticola]|uniref:MAPEG family protein n=1 Tax=Sphingomonas crusticola TaxID=1697973 RepID=UPI000E246F2C|nr:MAPEG family protein [Sphingomonas crusticola]